MYVPKVGDAVCVVGECHPHLAYRVVTVHRVEPDEWVVTWFDPGAREVVCCPVGRDAIVPATFLPFTRVALPYGWLGNMSAHPVVHEGVSWRTAEALFQALRFADPGVREEIRAQASPMAAKLVAKKHAGAMAVEPTSAADLDNMRLVLRLKAAQHPDLAEKLRGTGAAVLVEDVSNRRTAGRHLFWGMRNLGPTPAGPWDGENTLGRLWMALRAELTKPEESRVTQH